MQAPRFTGIGTFMRLPNVADMTGVDAAFIGIPFDTAVSYRIGIRPTEFLVGDPDTGVEVPLEDGLVWAAVHQDAIVVQLPERTGPLAGEPAAALLRRGSAS